MLNCHRLNSWICHKRITSNTFARNWFSSIKNERYGIEDDQTLSVQVWFKFSGFVSCLVGLCHLLFLAVACAKMDLLVTMHLLMCDDNPEMPGTMDQEDSNEAAEGAGCCARACEAQASARVDVPTARMTLKYTIEHADDGSGMCKAVFAKRRCSPCDFPFDCRWVQHARHHVRYGPERQQQR